MILLTNGDHKKLNATMIDETVTKPKVCLVTPAERSHKPKGMPKAKVLGRFCDPQQFHYVQLYFLLGILFSINKLRHLKYHIAVL